ncbi:hypothetical protein [Parasphingorhabdus sp.]|uniref:hypothetical protein n=1 Tax=Parasphingorhabdus sp. TaxID=2709688 RepID=UPI003001B6C7
MAKPAVEPVPRILIREGERPQCPAQRDVRTKPIADQPDGIELTDHYPLEPIWQPVGITLQFL